MSRGDRLDEAVIKLVEGDLENALIQVSICIDATAKAKYPQIKEVGRRVTQYITDNRDLIYHFMMGGRVMFTQEVIFSALGSLQDVIYKTIRCELLHEGDISGKVSYQAGFAMGMDNGKFIVTDSMLWGLVFTLIGDEVNADQRFKAPRVFRCFGTDIELDKMWGRVADIKRIVGFPVI